MPSARTAVLINFTLLVTGLVCVWRSLGPSAAIGLTCLAIYSRPER